MHTGAISWLCPYFRPHVRPPSLNFPVYHGVAHVRYPYHPRISCARRFLQFCRTLASFTSSALAFLPSVPKTPALFHSTRAMAANFRLGPHARLHFRDLLNFSCVNLSWRCICTSFRPPCAFSLALATAICLHTFFGHHSQVAAPGHPMVLSFWVIRPYLHCTLESPPNS